MYRCMLTEPRTRRRMRSWLICFFHNYGDIAMFERFTERAIKVMQYANQEAQRFNHEYIGTEHILIGLCKKASGVAATALRDAGLDFSRARREVEILVQRGPDMVTMGRLPQTPR